MNVSIQIESRKLDDLKFSQIVENIRTVHGTVGLIGGIQGDPIRRDVGGVEPEVPLVRVEKLLAVPSEIQTDAAFSSGNLRRG